MRLLIQEAQDAKVTVEGKTVGEIAKGEVVLVGFTNGDDKGIVDRMIDKLLKIRIFPDEKGLTNVNLATFGGNVLAVSQFTLYADMSQGNRPSFNKCMPKEQAKPLFDYFSATIKQKLPQVQFGIFHADMLVTFTNVGPFTILLDSDELGYGKEKDDGH